MLLSTYHFRTNPNVTAGKRTGCLKFCNTRQPNGHRSMAISTPIVHREKCSCESRGVSEDITRQRLGDLRSPACSAWKVSSPKRRRRRQRRLCSGQRQRTRKTRRTQSGRASLRASRKSASGSSLWRNGRRPETAGSTFRTPGPCASWACGRTGDRQRLYSFLYFTLESTDAKPSTMDAKRKIFLGMYG